jgi:hypothetical protein
MGGLCPAPREAETEIPWAWSSGQHRPHLTQGREGCLNLFFQV